MSASNSERNSTLEQKEELSRMEKILSDMENENFSELLRTEFPALAAKFTENEKLRYRLDILKRAATKLGQQNEQSDSEKINGVPEQICKIAANKNYAKSESKNNTNKPKSLPKPAIKYVQVEDFGDSLIEKINDLFSKIIEELFPGLGLNVVVQETSQLKYGDYQFNMCTLISRKLLTEHNVKKSVKDVAKEIVEKLPKLSLIEKAEIVNAYINIFVNKEHVCRRIAELFKNGILIPKVAKRNVVIDFSSPNIAKQMHVGHLRSTIIGDSISRLLEFVGFSVLRLNHVGDWGTQFGMLIAYLKDRFPNYLLETPPLQDLQTFYKESKVQFDEDTEFKARAYQCVVSLQNMEPDIVKAWNLICDVSRKDFAEIYKRLDVKLVERGESFYQSRMQSLVQELEGTLKEEEGRKLMFPKSCSIPLTLVKSDGGFTYDTSDLTAIRQRLFEEHGDWVLYVVDRGQSEHLETIFAAARDLGWYDPNEKRIEHIQFGLVLGEDKKKFKTRSGDTVKLTELLDEGLRRSEEKLIQKGRDKELSPEEFKAAKEAVAYGCIKYSDLLSARHCDYVFSFDRMLDDRGNTAVYLLYAYTRIRSIARTAQVSTEQIHEYMQSLGDSPLPLTHEGEFKLAKHILKFSDCLLVVLESLQLHKLCDYVYDLATLFHDFYKDCYVVSKLPATDGSSTFTTHINFHRLVLCEVVADLMKRCFHILGIQPVGRM